MNCWIMIDTNDISSCLKVFLLFGAVVGCESIGSYVCEASIYVDNFFNAPSFDDTMDREQGYAFPSILPNGGILAQENVLEPALTQCNDLTGIGEYTKPERSTHLIPLGGCEAACDDRVVRQSANRQTDKERDLSKKGASIFR